MNILLTLHEYLEPNSGAAGSTLQIKEQYQALGHQVYSYSFDDLPGWMPFKLKDAIFPECTAVKLSQLLKNTQIDIIDASTGDAWVWGNFLRASLERPPLLVTRSHGLDHVEHDERLKDVALGNLKLSWKYPLYRGSIQLWEIGQSLRCSDLTFFLNQYDADFAVQHLKVLPQKAQVFPNGLPSYFLNLPLEKIDDQRLRIAHVGTYIQRKGIQYSAPALNQILLKYPQVEVSFIGTELNGFGTVDQVYADFDPQIHDRLTVVPYYNHQDLPSLLKGCDIKLFPTLSEGFGKALIEAMACGLAPITTPTPGPLDIVQDGHDALLVPLRDSQAIVDALERLIHNPVELTKLQKNAYQTAQKYSWTTIAQQRLAAYEAALDARQL
ncbi:MAG: glycosyltransferase family 4 protein [Acaryochloridaceae cyanobacterium SU_2_1]|nr:glycosyltransferase family 4 protein [Acaryochloridaceae cyanobacterium SU_2_1]